MTPTHLAREPGLPRGDQARAKLLLAAAELFAAHGREGATTRQIAARAGQNIASIAYYFGGKDGLYLGVAEETVRQFDAALGDMVTTMEAFLQRPVRRRDRTEAAGLVRRFTDAAVEGLLLRPELLVLTEFILREQLHPTRAFDLIYDGALGRIHRALTGLVAAALGQGENATESVVRAHAILGQVLGFRVARAAFLRRAGWPSIGRREATLIARVVGENVEAILVAPRRRR